MNTVNVIKSEHSLWKPKQHDAAIDILLTADKQYLPYCGVCIYSIINNNKDLKINFHIITQAMVDRAFTEQPGSNVSLTVYLIDDASLAGLQTHDFFPVSIYYRILAPEILGHEAKRILYLDCDILCDGDITALITLDMGTNIVAAVKDAGINEAYLTQLNLKKGEYFNSGVMLINTALWLDKGITTTFFEKINSKKYLYPDQDCLNEILKGETLSLDNAYNYIPKNRSTTKKPVFIHYAGQTKPWSISIDESGYNKKYLDLYRNTPWKSLPLLPPKKPFEAYHYSRKLLSQKKLLQSLYWFTQAMYGMALKTLKRAR